MPDTIPIWPSYGRPPAKAFITMTPEMVITEMMIALSVTLRDNPREFARITGLMMCGYPIRVARSQSGWYFHAPGE